MKTSRLFKFLISLLIGLVILSVIVSVILFLLDNASGAEAPEIPTSQSVQIEPVTPSVTHPPAPPSSAPVSQPETDPSQEITPVPTEAIASTTVPETTVPTEAPVLHSELYIEGIDVVDVITYFNEVCLDAEFTNGGDAALLQKWSSPICYIVNGTPMDEDLAVLESFADWLNTIDGFPGISETSIDAEANLHIYFCQEDTMINILGENFYGNDGGVTFWYMDNEIYNANICYRTDIDQYVRNSVILEEIFNGLGPVQDTDLREDSIAYSGYSTPQELTPIDELILKLLYHPQIQCGMDAAECEIVIRQLYY